jgi:ribonucleoside-diphosphate reductase alpha chain
MAAALGLRYGSDDCIEICEQIHKEMALTAYRASVEMARTRGPFPLYNYEEDQKSAFIQRICAADPQLAADMKTYGRRNIALLTIAPTGSVSIMTQTSSGIEPVFAVYYKRNRKVNVSEDVKSMKVTVDAIGDKWVQYNVVHHKFLKWLELNNIKIDINNDKDLKKYIELSPYHLSTANDIDWLAKVRMQGRIQQWIDHSISVTINVPKHCTESKINDLYIAAWKEGCKGCTVYRDGCRDGVLVTDTTEQSESMPKKRPRDLKCDIIYFKNNKEQWVAFIGLIGDKPYEIFTGRLDDIKISTKLESGIITKDNGKYTFRASNADSGTVILSECFDQHYWNYAILLSKIMRLGYDIEKLVDTVRDLRFHDNENINTWKTGVARALSKYISSGTISRRHKCTCGETFIYQEGCLTCMNCGNSKCN